MTPTKARPLTGLLSAALLTATLTGATAAQDREFEITPEGADWTLSAYTVDDTITPIPFGVEVTMYLEDGEVSGNSGCNTFVGTYQLDGSEILFEDEMRSTLALCLDPARSVEDAFIPLLASVESWNLEEAIIDLSDAAGEVVLTFEEPLIDVTQTDAAALTSELIRLDNRISRTREDIRELDVPGLRTDVEGIDAKVKDLNKRLNIQDTSALEDRVGSLESVVADQSNQISKMRTRQKDLEERVTLIEEMLGASVSPEEEPKEPAEVEKTSEE